MSHPVQTKLPLGPLLAHVTPEAIREQVCCIFGREPWPGSPLHDRFYEIDNRQSVLARRHGVSLRQVQRWRVEGVPYFTADRIAVALGLHPVDVWPWWYELEPLAVAS